MTALSRALGEAVLAANLRHAPEDFLVEEIDAFKASGSGEHALVRVEKTGITTLEAAKRLARWAGIAESAVGYAGLKDRHAVARQRFTLWRPGKPLPNEPLHTPELRVQDMALHHRKLPRGALKGNRFVLNLRDVKGVQADIEARLHAIQLRGVPNAFGEQRFGRHGDNIAQVLGMFAGRRVRREERSLLLSAARSHLFNQVLAARIQANIWDTPVEGDVCMLEGSHSVFGPETVDDALRARATAFDIHPTGPLWGRGELRTTGLAREIELHALDDSTARQLRKGLEHAGLKQERRALRLRVQDLGWQWLGEDVLQLQFALPPGSYATVVLNELGEVTDLKRNP